MDKNELSVLCNEMLKINASLGSIVQNVHFNNQQYIDSVCKLEEGFAQMLNFVLKINDQNFTGRIMLDNDIRTILEFALSE